MTRCLVPFCRRNKSLPEGHEWICGKHWPLTSKKLRRLYFLCKRRQLHHTAWGLWCRLREQAIERAGGLQ